MESEANYDDFLNPKSMLTPGLAGSMTMLITNALSSEFGLWPNWTALIISFLFGLLVFASAYAVWWLRIVLYLLNSLFIFSVALGTNQLGVRAINRSDVQPVAGVNSVPFAGVGLPALNESNTPFKEAFFADWLDGTVPNRKRLIVRVEKLNDPEARLVLNFLGFGSTEFATSKSILSGTVARTRTVEQVKAIGAAIDKVQTADLKSNSER